MNVAVAPVAVVGIAARQFWISAPRWAYVPIHLAHGLVAVWYPPAFAASGGIAVVWLVAGGGLVYALGALAYGTRRPEPLPGTFGHHGVFHACTAIAWLLHYVAILMAVAAQPV